MKTKKKTKEKDESASKRNLKKGVPPDGHGRV